MTTNEARQILNSEARRHTCVVYFTKRDGSERRMVCRYYGHTSKAPHLLLVWDMERGAERNVNLRTVRKIKVLDRPPVRRSFEDLRREMQDLF